MAITNTTPMPKQKTPKSNYAFIDAANLHRGTKDEGFAIDYHRLRVWLSDKFQIEKAFLFIGLMPEHSDLYTNLQEAGYILVFKPTVTDPAGKVKGNCDADMVLHIAIGVFENAFQQAVLVTSDGDFYSTVEFLQKRQQLAQIVSPSPKCSILLKRTGAPITYLHDIKKHIKYKKVNKKEKPPVPTTQHKGLFRGDSENKIARRKRQRQAH